MLRGGQFLREVELKNDFARRRRGKEMTLHAFKGVVSRRGGGQAGDLREMASGAQPSIARKAKLGINLDHVGQLRELLAQQLRRAGAASRRSARLRGAWAAA